MYGTWEEVRTELDSLEEETGPELQHLVAKLQLAARAEQPYGVELMAAMVAFVRGAAEAAGEGGTTTEVLSDPQAIAQRFEQPRWSPEIAQNAGRIINHIHNEAPAAPKADEPQPLAMPVVLVTLDRAGMEELTGGQAFDGLPDKLREHFEQMETLLREEGLGDWSARYGDRAGDWRPFGAGGLTIEQLIRETFEAVNQSEGYEPSVVPWFLDVCDVWNDRSRLRRLRQGCLVILDSFSMRHPAVQSWFHRSLLDAYPTTAVLSVAPIQRAFDAGRKLSVIVQLQLDELEFARRLLDIEEDTGVCLETTNQAEIQKWLATRIRKLAPEAGAATGIRKFMPWGAAGVGR